MKVGEWAVFFIFIFSKKADERWREGGRMSTSGNQVGAWSRRKIREKEKRQEVKKKNPQNVDSEREREVQT